MALLKEDLRNTLFVAIRDSSIDDHTWSAALSSLPAAYKHELPGADGNAAQLFQTLVTLNNSGRLTDGTLPLEVVLANLRMLTTKAEVAELAAKALTTIDHKTNLAQLPEYKPAGQPEAYVGVADEMLPFDFLVDGATTGKSVAKILVPRYEAGVRAHGPDGRPRIFNGTVWMIGPKLAITNLHVMCARESDEADPSAADLGLQIKEAVCHFDYDRDHANPHVVNVAQMVCHGQRGGQSDFAILELEMDPTTAPPLKLRRQLPSIPKEGYSVNVIQHPGGMPKRVAARANLLKSAVAERLEYFSDTLGGSSGSPLCNDAWEVIGMHRASGPATNVMVKGKLAASHNEGIPIGAILAVLEKDYGNIAAQIRPHIQS